MSKYKDPEGGLTEAGRRKFERSGQSKNLQPGVKKSNPTGQSARRKGSFLTRFYTNPSGPLINDAGKPTRLALAANGNCGPLILTNKIYKTLKTCGKFYKAAPNGKRKEKTKTHTK